jgi:hypothetical protein
MVETLATPTAEFSPFPERAIRTYEDWRAYVSKPSAIKPAMPTAAEYNNMSKGDRKAFDQARTYYHNSFGPILVPAMEKIHTAALRLTSQNLRAQPGARPGIIMDGLSTVGKSTIAMQLGRRYERLVTKDFKITTAPSGQSFVPVAFINLPGEMSIMNFNALLAKFYNIPYSKGRDKEYFLTDRIKEHAADCATSMFVLDDIHFLQIKNRTHETLNNHIKHLANSISATFIYAGINLEGTGLLTEGKSVERAEFSQTGHRFKKFDLVPYRYSDDKSRAEFFTVLSSFESHLILFGQVPGALAREFGEYIYIRTGGFLGPISTMIREAASMAIKSKFERITIDILRKIKLDYDSEQRFKFYKKKMQAADQRATG